MSVLLSCAMAAICLYFSLQESLALYILCSMSAVISALRRSCLECQQVKLKELHFRLDSQGWKCDECFRNSYSGSLPPSAYPASALRSSSHPFATSEGPKVSTPSMGTSEGPKVYLTWVYSRCLVGVRQGCRGEGLEACRSAGQEGAGVQASRAGGADVGMS